MNNTTKTIFNQLGNKALIMMGAKNLAAGKTHISFKIGRNSKSITHITIKINLATDLYEITFHKIRKFKDNAKKFEGIYADMMHNLIEKKYRNVFKSVNLLSPSRGFSPFSANK